MIQIKLQKPLCPICDLPAMRSVDTMNVLTRLIPIANQERFAYDMSADPVIMPATLFTPRNKNGTIDVRCAHGHQWQTGMQHVPPTAAERVTAQIHREMMDAGVATEETPPGLAQARPRRIL